MNRERLADLADIIENDKIAQLQFDMGKWGNEEFVCGTRACIAGYAVSAAYGVDRMSKMGCCEIEDEAVRILGLSAKEANELFCSFGSADGPQGAARVLRHAAKTGKIDWSVA